MIRTMLKNMFKKILQQILQNNITNNITIQYYKAIFTKHHYKQYNNITIQYYSVSKLYYPTILDKKLQKNVTKPYYKTIQCCSERTGIQKVLFDLSLREEIIRETIV